MDTRFELKTTNSNTMINRLLSQKLKLIGFFFFFFFYLVIFSTVPNPCTIQIKQPMLPIFFPGPNGSINIPSGIYESQSVLGEDVGNLCALFFPPPLIGQLMHLY